MSLDNIQLPVVTIEDIYQKVLVDLNPVKQNTAPTKTPSLNVLGKNQRRITIVVKYTDDLYIPSDEMNFLLGILSACKLTMEDVAIINIDKNVGISYLDIAKELKAEKVFLFGIETIAIELPLQFPQYKIQSYNNQAYLTAPTLTALQHDKAEKTKLWLCLKELFSI